MKNITTRFIEENSWPAGESSQLPWVLVALAAPPTAIATTQRVNCLQASPSPCSDISSPNPDKFYRCDNGHHAERGATAFGCTESGAMHQASCAKQQGEIIARRDQRSTKDWCYLGKTLLLIFLDFLMVGALTGYQWAKLFFATKYLDNRFLKGSNAGSDAVLRAASFRFFRSP